jgi:hypothetical protein
MRSVLQFPMPRILPDAAPEDPSYRGTSVRLQDPPVRANHDDQEGRESEDRESQPLGPHTQHGLEFIPVRGRTVVNVRRRIRLVSGIDQQRIKTGRRHDGQIECERCRRCSTASVSDEATPPDIDGAQKRPGGMAPDLSVQVRGLLILWAIQDLNL